jgi:gliding motility-associated-like protein
MKKLLPIIKNVITKGSRSFSAVVLLLILLGITKSTQAQVYYLINSTTGNTTNAANALKKVDYTGSNDGNVTTGIPNPILAEVDAPNNRVFTYNGFLGSRVINVVNMGTGEVINTITLPAGIQVSGPSVTAIKYDPINDWVYYVTNSNGGSATLNAVYRSKPDGTQNAALATGIATLPQWLALDIPNNRVFIYEGVFSGRKILTFDLGSNTVTGNAPVSNIANAIAYDPITDYLYYITSDNDQINAGTTNDALRKIRPGGSGGEILIKSSLVKSPQYMALDAGNNRAFVYNGYYGSSTTIRLDDTGIYSVDLTTGATTRILDHSGLQNTPNYLRVFALFTPARPIVSTTAVTAFSSASATLGGNITRSEASVTERGVIYSSSNTTPTIGGSGVTKATNGSGTGSFSASISSLSAATTYYVRAYATSGAGTTYGTVTSFSTQSNDANLSAFTISAGTLTPAFAAGTISYTASVTNANSTITVTPIKNNVNASIKVNNVAVTSGTASGNIPLNVGDNTITTVVTAQDGTTTKTYTLTVNRPKAVQTITFAGTATKTYGDGDFAPGATASSGLGISYSSDNLGVATIVSGQIHIVGVGTANITASQAGDGNYLAAGNVVQVLTINKATVMVTANAQTKVYGNNDPAFTYTATGVVGSDAATGALTRAAGTNIGNYAINQGTLSYGNNYNITYVAANLTITKRPITIRPLANTKVYGAADPYLNAYAIEGGGSLAPNEGSTGAFGRATGENVGTYVMELGGKTILNINTSEFTTNNYDITIIPSNFTITAKTINVIPNALTKVYGEADPELTYSHDELAFNDTFDGSLSRFIGEDVNSYYITVGDLELSNNYIMSFNYGNKLTITPKTINVTANAKTKTYGTADPAFDYTYDALAFTDSFTGSLTRDAGEGAGDHAITQGSLALNSNYTLNYTGANLTIGKANLTYVATPASRPFQTANPTFTGSVTGFISGDTQGSATTGTLSFTSTTTLNSAMGSYPIVGSGLSAANYDFVQASANSTALTITESTDATLAGLTVDEGTLNPVFSSSQTSYGFSVNNNIASFTLTATVNQQNASINVNGTTITSGSPKNIALNTGPNNINVIVTAQDGSTTQQYTLNVFRTYDNNNLLASLNLSGITYSPSFDANTLNYTATVSNLVTSTDVTATAVSPTTHIFVGGYDLATTNPVNTTLNVGETEVVIVSKAENSDEKIYKVNVTRAQSADATLASIGNNTITLNTPFVSGTHTYSATVATGVGALTFLPTSTNNAAVIKVNNQALNAGSGNTVLLSFGANSVVIDVTSEDGLNHIPYVLNINRLRSADATLASLSFPFITSLNEEFNPNVYQYTATVADSTYTGIPLSAISTDENAIVKIDGTVVPRFVNYTLPVQGGPNTYHVVVTSQDTSATKTYTLVLTRAGTPPPPQSPVANLLALNVSSGSGFSNNFNFSIGEELRTIYAPNNIEAVRIFTVSENTVSTVTINGVVLPYDNTTELLPITLGDNVFTIVVTSEDGAHTKSYDVHVNRLPFADVTLAALSINAGTLSPAFVPATRLYTVSVPNNISSIRVTPVATVGTATIQIGSTQISTSNPTASVDLYEGTTNNIRVEVTAADGITKQTYTIRVTREALVLSNNAAAVFVLNPSSTLINTTGSANYNYTTSVSAGTSSINLKTVARDANAVIRVNGNVVTSGVLSDAITLNTGATVINVSVTAQDGVTVKTYSITVNREGSNNAVVSLKLTPSSTLVSTGVTGTTVTYSTTVDPATSSITITPTAQEEHASILVNGVAVASGTASAPIALNIGSTVIAVVVTAQDGISTRSYSITVTRDGSNNAAAVFVLNPSSTLTNATGSANYNYTTSVYAGTSSVSLKTVARDANAVIRVNGNVVTSGEFSNPIALNAGPTVINVLVTAQDGVTVKTYSITVNREGSNNAVVSLKITPSATMVSTGVTGTTVNYNTSVDPGITSVTLTPTAQEEHATILVNGVAVASGTASAPIALNVGSTVIAVNVTAQDGISTRSYTVTVEHTGSNNAAAVFVLNPYPSSTLINSTGPATYNYVTSVSAGASSVILKTIARDINAVIRVNGDVVASGVFSNPITLNGGSTVINISVTAQDGVTVKTYSITVNRNGSNNAFASFKLKPSSPLVSTGVTEETATYTTTVNAGTGSVTLTPTAQDEHASILVNGVAVASGTASAPIALNAGGATQITIVVTAEDGVTSRSYSINVNRPLDILLVNRNDSKLLFANKPANNVAPTGDDGVVVHQGISPNGDGSNDFLYIEGISAYPGNKLAIMNSSGALVFETNDYGKDGNRTFDGHSNKNGALLKPGTYFYALEYQVNKQSKRKTGYIVIKY